MRIEIYPACNKPKWVKVGVWCHVLGEAYDKFIIKKIIYNGRAVVLEGHGTESINKCYQFMHELKERRGWK